MRTIKYTSQFKRDYKREEKSHQHPELDKLLLPVIKLQVKPCGRTYWIGLQFCDIVLLCCVKKELIEYRSSD